jgi:alkanesulfonate monooxygenase SsuD/methylene tetrahydromethanopterin reductase-like flavin-dependent oxidoreductase (luciferase family)
VTCVKTPRNQSRALGLPLAIAIIGGESARFGWRSFAARRAGFAPESLAVGINGHGFLADTAEAAVDASSRRPL